MKDINIKKGLLIFILFNTLFATFYLYTKHTVGNDSSISEWLINYQGGFTRRGFGGELAISIANLFDITLRKSIFFIQLTVHLTYLFLVFNYIKNIRINIFQLFALFVPIFLLYPIAEIEVLGRKEMLMFLFFITVLFLCDKKFPKFIVNSYVCIFFPIGCLVWEQVILYAPFIAVTLTIKNNLITLTDTLKKLTIIFIPTIFTMMIIFAFPLSKEGHQIMCDFLSNEFGETCYMSANLLVSNTIYFDTFDFVHKNNSIFHYLRYVLIFLISFLPLNILVSQNKFVKKENFISKNFNLNILFFILYFPAILLFTFGYDWGRWVNITYSFSILFYFYLLKNSIITNELNITNTIWEKIFKKKIVLTFIFILFAFFWNPKTVITGDISTNSVYKIIYNATKQVFGFGGYRLFQNNPIIKFHKEYIE